MGKTMQATAAGDRPGKPPPEGPGSRRRRALLWGLVALALLGLGVAGELTFIHFRVHTDPGYRSFCSLSSRVNCDSVAESPYSIFLGLPVSVWGLLGYALIAGLAAWGLRRDRPRSSWPAGLLLLATGFATLVSLALAGVSELAVGAFCLLCATSWLLNAAMLALALSLARLDAGDRRAQVPADLRVLRRNPGLAAQLLVPALGLLSAVWLFYPRYWQTREPSEPPSLTRGEENGLPWIGAPSPRLTITEFSDYECPYCARAHFAMQTLLERRRDVRLIHRHFPLDNACNPAIAQSFHRSACRLATAALCAEAQGRLWEMSDALFRRQAGQEISVEALAQQLGLNLDRFRACLASPATASRLDGDIQAGIRAGVRGTPTYLVGDQSFLGQIPPEVLRQHLSN